MTNHPTATGARTRPPIALLTACFDLRSDGNLVWRVRPSDHFSLRGLAQRTNLARAGKIAGCVGKDGYLLVRVSLQGLHWLLPAHQIVWAMTHGEWPSSEIDHRDNDRSNNRPDNLRLAERPQNMANMRTHKDNQLGIKGVFFDRRRGKFIATICHHRRQIRLGAFASAEDASAAYAAKARELNGEFARGEPSE